VYDRLVRDTWTDATILQFFADQIDQMDLCLDQLAMRERNFDRFAIVLVDNVVELTLHRHVRDTYSAAMMIRGTDRPRHDLHLLRKALGQEFRPKVELAKQSRMLSVAVADSICSLHEFRNRAYHAGDRHEAVLHALAIFYFEIACTVLAAYRPRGWSRSTDDKLSHRTLKYIGTGDGVSLATDFLAVWRRLQEVGSALGDSLLADLGADLEQTIETVDDQIRFLVDNDVSPSGRSREEVIAEAELSDAMFSDDGHKFAVDHGGPTTGPEYFNWMRENYQCTIQGDPIPGWRNELCRLRAQTDRHRALRIYCGFMKDTNRLRGVIDGAAASLDEYIQSQIDAAREDPGPEPETP